jgi:hypothetical protein
VVVKEGRLPDMPHNHETYLFSIDNGDTVLRGDTSCGLLRGDKYQEAYHCD